MTTRAAHPSGYNIYPICFFEASRTWRQWNPLTAADVHALRTEHGFRGQPIYFHLNHPIKYVRLVGLVVDIAITTNGKHILISLDDSSGACIEVKTSFRDVKEDDPAEYPSNTKVDNLDVHDNLGNLSAFVNKERIDIGTVIKAKGTIDTFRGIRQLKLERIWVVKDTNAEAIAWAEAASWKRDVLFQPWVLTKEERDEIDERLKDEGIRERKRYKKVKQRTARHEEKRRRKLEKIERRRKREEERLNTGAMVGSNVLPDRITDS